MRPFFAFLYTLDSLITNANYFARRGLRGCFEMESTNAKKGGNAEYNVILQVSPGSVRFKDELAMTDALGFASLDADLLADVSASSLAELSSVSAWQTAAKLA